MFIQAGRVQKNITPKAQDFKIWIISPHGKFYSVIILPVA